MAERRRAAQVLYQGYQWYTSETARWILSFLQHCGYVLGAFAAEHQIQENPDRGLAVSGCPAFLAVVVTLSAQLGIRGGHSLKILTALFGATIPFLLDHFSDGRWASKRH